MRGGVSFISLAALLGVAWCIPATAQRDGAKEDVAIVEDVSLGVGELRPLDLIAGGRVAELGQNGRIVLGYLKSCWQDSVSGGRVVVEPQKSLVEGGALTRRRVECDAAGLSRMNSAGLSARGVVLAGSTLPEPDVNLYGLSPIIISPQLGPLLIERLDAAAAPLRFELVESKVDLHEKNIALDANGLYRFTRGTSIIIVRIDRLAEPGRAPAVGRLVIFR